MFFQEVSQNSNTATVVLGAIVILLSTSLGSAFTYWLTKGKTSSETLKNLADAHKSEADMHKSEAETIKILNDELDKALITAKALRRRITKFEILYETEVKVILNLLEKILEDVNEVIDYLITNSLLPEIRIKAVKALNSLYTIKDILKKRQLNGDE